jgi:DNA-binding MarR family transcriptional regulator
MDKEKSSHSLVEIISYLTRAVAEMQSDEIRSLSDLSLRQIYYLETVARLKNPTPTELARRLKVSKPSASAAIEHLAQEGYVDKVQSDDDRRSFHVHLTEKGERLAAAHEAVHEHIVQALTKGLDQSEIEQLTRLLDKIIRSLET